MWRRNFRRGKMDNIRLIQMAKYAYAEVPFYRNLAMEKNITVQEMNSMEEFQNLPLIDKGIFQRSKKQTLAERYYSYQNRRRIILRRTSGSTGKYLKIYWDYQDNIKSLVELWYNRKKYYDIHPRDKYCYFYTTGYKANKLVEETECNMAVDKSSLGFSKNNLDEERLIDICKRMYEFDPSYLLVQPSMAVLIMDCMEREKLPKLRGLKYIELTGEMLLNAVRNRIGNFFGCSVCNQYGCNETNCIASEHGGQELYVHTSNVYVEIIRNGVTVQNGETGDIYVTSLTNYAMPFIRYKTGDQGSLESKNGKQILKLERGRESQYIIDRYNNKLPFYILMRPIEHINERIGDIIYQFQVTQMDIDDFIVYFSINPSYKGWKKTIEEVFISNIKQTSLEGAKWKFEYREELYPDDFTGKLSYFHSEMKV